MPADHRNRLICTLGGDQHDSTHLLGGPICACRATGPSALWPTSTEFCRTYSDDGELTELTAVVQERDRTIAACAAHSTSSWSSSRLANWHFTSQRA
jgi:hypothetical protein